LVHDRVGHERLGLVPAGAHDAHVGLGVQEAVDQRGLAGARRAGDQRDPRAPRAHGVKQRAQRAEVLLPCDEWSWQPRPTMPQRAAGYTPPLRGAVTAVASAVLPASSAKHAAIVATARRVPGRR
jgi:hypothetical protein